MVAIENEYALFLGNGSHRSYFAFVRTLHDGYSVTNFDTQVLHASSPLAGEVSLPPSKVRHGSAQVHGAPVGPIGVFDGCIAAWGQRTQLIVLAPGAPRGFEGSVGISEGLHALFKVLLLLGPFVDILAQGFSASNLLLSLRRPLQKLLHGE